MRWILTWKMEKDEQGNITGKRAKARLIIRGFEDPGLMTLGACADHDVGKEG